MRLVFVRWIDSHSMPGWHAKAAVDEFIADAEFCASAGFVVHDDSASLVLAQNVTSYDSWGELMKIPRFAIQSVEELGEREMKAKDGDDSLP